jgi:hypothetical protein
LVHYHVAVYKIRLLITKIYCCLKDKIKAFIWNQGENNSGDSVLDYKNALKYQSVFYQYQD